MPNRIVATALLPLLLAAVAACGNSGTTDSEPAVPTATTTAPAPTAAPDQTGPAEDGSVSPSADTESQDDTSPDEPTAGSAVARYCQDVDELIEEYRKALADPTQSNAADVARKSQELAGQAAELARAAISDPSVGEQIRECSKRLENLGNAEQQ